MTLVQIYHRLRLCESTEIRTAHQMNGRPLFGTRHLFFVGLVGVNLLAVFFSACDKAASPPATQQSVSKLASMVPAATDLLVGMGAKDRLVAISNYVDPSRSDVGFLPRAGDYQTVDWEMLRSLHPTFLISEIQPKRQSPGFKARLDELHIKTLNVQIEQMSDIFTTLDELGKAIQEPDLAKAASTQMHLRLNAVQLAGARVKPVSVLLVIDVNATAVVGPGTYLDDLLKIAGGDNVAAPLHQHWPQIDREMLLSLKPDVIIQLLPDASPQERTQAAAVWTQYSRLPAVAEGRVYPIYDWYALVPGWHVTDLAEQFSRCLHPPQSTSQP